MSNSPFSRNLLNPEDLNLDLVLNFFGRVMTTKNLRYLFPEEPYKKAIPSILLESLYTDIVDGSLPSDLKLFMFRGQLKLIRYHSMESNTSLAKYIDEFDANWIHLPNEFREP